jgi:hypothetical protein
MTAFRQFKAILDTERWGRDVTRKLNNLFNGKLNVVGEVTLTANSGTTALNDNLIGLGSLVALMPMSSNAAAALATTYFSAPTAGSVTINHASNAQTDRTFRYAVLG